MFLTSMLTQRSGAAPTVMGMPTVATLAALGYAGYNHNVTSISQTMRIKVLFFGRLKEIAGVSEESLELNSEADIEALFAQYAVRYPQLSQYRSSVVASCNQEFAAWATPLHGGDEVAFLPPVSGG